MEERVLINVHAANGIFIICQVLEDIFLVM